jgi:hypothetical protein
MAPCTGCEAIMSPILFFRATFDLSVMLLLCFPYLLLLLQ